MYLDMLTYVLITLAVIAFIVYIAYYLTRSKSLQESVPHTELFEEIKKMGVSYVECTEIKHRIVYSILLNNNLYVHIMFDADNRHYTFKYKKCIRLVEGHMNVIRARNMLYRLLDEYMFKRTETYPGCEIKTIKYYTQQYNFVKE